MNKRISIGDDCCVESFFIRYRKYKFLGAKKMRLYEPQRHNAANAARKGVHEKINKNPLCPLRLCGSIRFIGFLIYQKNI